ncbi:MAG: response regulator, partial [Deltaproteobacteria bacterium]|nr:response regulator [Deltaproteobacteria bacterium]
NITERKEIDQALIEAKDAAEDANKAKSDFLATISHEIRTPIAAVNGVADLFKETKLDAKQKKYVNVIESASELLLNLINNVLDISKMESGKLELDYAEFNLKEVTEKMASVLSIKAEEKGLLLVEHIDDDVPLSLVGDSVRLKEALLNLLGNAVKFTEKGSVELLVSLVSEEPGESVLLRFEIKDTGVGISRDKQSMVFEKFSQADTSTTRRYGGTGLGLAITKDLVKLMGGDISVKSKVGEGSSFIFTAKFNLRSINDKSYDPKEGDLIDERPLKVLIVEDSAHIVFILQAFLSNTNYELSFAEDGKRGLDKFKEGSFDIILMDMEMPAMDGYTATKLIRELEKKDNKKDHVPIVAITAHALSEFKEKSMSAGCDAHLAKPIKKNELLAAIIKYTDGGDSLVMQGGEELHAVASKDLEMLIPEYLEDIRQEALTVEGLLEEKDFAKTQDIGHRLKGSGMTYGFIPITELGAVIEEESINKSSKAVMKAIGQLIYYLDNVKVKYE